MGETLRSSWVRVWSAAWEEVLYMKLKRGVFVKKKLEEYFRDGVRKRTCSK
jgi:hypothetical protein